jgi:histidine triad (HIT) family protein
MSDCLFCKIRDGVIPSHKVHEDDRCFAIRDIEPQAPTHLLVIPRQHIATLNDLTAADEPLVGHLHTVAAKLARDEGHAADGWRALFNVNRAAGQLVFHIHLHVLGGRDFDWPPG